MTGRSTGRDAQARLLALLDLFGAELDDDTREAHLRYWPMWRGLADVIRAVELPADALPWQAAERNTQ
jgi:hypothetical protein